MSKIISIGNISLGGTGKTPFTIKVAKHYINENKKVCILSRGYKGGLGYDTNIISDGNEILFAPPKAADEPYMIAREVPKSIVITGKDRNQSYEFAVKKFNPDIFILDDGFQHKKMKRDVDILLLSHHRPASTGLPFPFGYLREFPSGIKRADIIVFTRAKKEFVPKEVTFYVKDKPIFYSDTKPVAIFKDREQFDIADFFDKYAFAFSGIAKNMNFYNSLLENGIGIIGNKNFMDHHTYSESDIKRVKTLAERKKADFIITTEKDYVKIPKELRQDIYYLKIDVVLNNEDLFFEEIDKVLDNK